MEKVGITGGAGFLGSYVVDKIIEEGEFFPVVLDNLRSGKLSNLKYSKYDLRVVDLRKHKNIKEFSGLKYVIHLAAIIGGIGCFHKLPATIIQDNNAINNNVFEACVKYDIERLTNVSSSMVFENVNVWPTREKDLIGCPPPTSAYGFQKLMGEYYCKSFCEEYGLEYSIARPFNAIGPREYPGETVGWAHVIPDLCKKIIIDKQSPLEIFGDGNQVRCYTDARDIASGIYECTFNENAKNEDFNVANDEQCTVIELANKIWNAAGREEDISFKHLLPYPYDVQMRVPDNEKIKEKLNWEPKYNLDTSIDNYVKWFIEEVE